MSGKPSKVDELNAVSTNRYNCTVVTSYKNLSQKQLDRIIDETQKELERRSKIQKATQEVKAILARYELELHHLDASNLSVKQTVGRKKTRSNQKPNDKRSQVKAIYKNPNGPETWSGRGRSPKWVLSVCKEESIDLAEFKKSKKFKYK